MSKWHFLKTPSFWITIIIAPLLIGLVINYFSNKPTTYNAPMQDSRGSSNNTQSQMTGSSNSQQIAGPIIGSIITNNQSGGKNVINNPKVYDSCVIKKFVENGLHVLTINFHISDGYWDPSTSTIFKVHLSGPYVANASKEFPPSGLPVQYIDSGFVNTNYNISTDSDPDNGLFFIKISDPPKDGDMGGFKFKSKADINIVEWDISPKSSIFNCSTII